MLFRSSQDTKFASAFVALALTVVWRKIGALRQGVHFRRLTGSRTARSSHTALTRAYTRFLLGETSSLRGLWRRRLSNFLQRKVLVHLLLTQLSRLRVWQLQVATTRVANPPPQPTLDLMLQWREIRTALQRVLASRRILAKASLEMELLTASSCSYSHLSGAA